MPELPDVEVFKRYLDATSLHQPIRSVQFFGEGKILEKSPDELAEHLKGPPFESSRRHGKYLFVELDDTGWLVLHFGMTGELEYYKNGEEPPEFTKMLIDFDNGYHLAVINIRKLGEIGWTDHIEGFIEEKDLGPDPYGPFDFERFLSALEGSRAMIKTALMDQSRIAGLGNVYVTEILFQCGIHPETKVMDLDKDQLRSIYDRMNQVLEVAIEHQADPPTYPDDWLIHHRQPGEHCPRCGTELKRIELSGRATYLCPQCQGSG